MKVVFEGRMPSLPQCSQNISLLVVAAVVGVIQMAIRILEEQKLAVLERFARSLLLAHRHHYKKKKLSASKCL
jgi:hypothetical protein